MKPENKCSSILFSYELYMNWQYHNQNASIFKPENTSQDASIFWAFYKWFGELNLLLLYLANQRMHLIKN
jgi:hypothetical protein